MATNVEQDIAKIKQVVAELNRELKATTDEAKLGNLTASIEKLNTIAEKLRNNIALTAKEFRNLERVLKTNAAPQAAPQSSSANLAALDAKRQALLLEQERLRKSGQTTVNTQTASYSTIYPPGVEDRINKITAAVIRLNEAEAKLRGGRINDSVAVVPPGATVINRPAGAQTPGYIKAEEALFGGAGTDAKAEAEKQKHLKALERKRIAEEKAAFEAERRAKVLSDPRYRQALEQAGKLGLGIENLSKIEDRGGGIQQLLFRGQQGGINQNFRTYVDPTGKSTPGLSSQFRTFGSDILRDIGQFTKWSIAVAAVYTPIQKLGELLTNMVDIQSRLADATIAANIPFERSGEIFDEAYQAAQRAGEGIAGVVDAYSQAYRAAGRYEDQQERNQKTTDLLNSSLILSKLSTLEQAEAIDTLSAALLQSEMELDQGEVLLNKWVRVSQIANVEIAALATGVAVLGDSAEAAGLDIDHLNGLIAVLSEQSISGSKEAANTAKALIGAYQGDKAEATLTKYGFALRKTNGEVRDFLDVYRELATAREQGLLSEANVSEIATALGGGGSRRAKDVAALINSQDRLNKIAKESSLIAGDSTLAQDSLSKKLETVETASTRLSNSFMSLAQTLGNEGGLLDTFTDLLNLLNTLVTGFDKLFESLGRAGPILTTALAGMFALSRISPSRTLTMMAGLGANITSGATYGGGQFIPGGGRAPAGGLVIPPGVTSNYGGGIAGIGRGMMTDVMLMAGGYRNAGAWRGGGLLGLLGVGASAISNVRQGEGDRAAGNAIGGVIGGAIGAYLGGPAGLAIGANIGSAVGDSFVSSVLEFEPEFEKFFNKFLVDGGPSEAGTALDSETRRNTLSQQALESSGYGPLELAFDEFLVKTDDFFGDILGDWARVLPNIDRENFSKESLIYANISPEMRKKLQNELEIEQARSGKANVYLQPEFEEDRKRLQQEAIRERERQLNRLSAGEISSGEFGKITERLAGFPAVAIRGMEAFGEEFISASKDIEDATDAYEAFLFITTYGAQEQIDIIGKYATDIEYLGKLIDGFNNDLVGTKAELSIGDIDIESKKQLEDLKNSLKLEAGTAISTIAAQIRLQQTRLPNIVGSATEATPQTDIDLIKQQAKELQDQFYTDMDLSTDAIEYLTENLEDFAVLVGDAADNHFQTISGIDQKFWDAAQKLLAEQNKLASDNKLGLQQFDVDRATLERLAGQSIALGSSWAEKFNYDFKPEDQIAISQEGIVKPLHADFRILALLLEKIVDQNQKQLDGQYNIPEGATFWVPLTAAYYRNTGNNGDTDISKWLSELDTESLDTAGNELQAAAQSLMDAAGAQKDAFITDAVGGPLVKKPFFAGEYDYPAQPKEPEKPFFSGGMQDVYDTINRLLDFEPKLDDKEKVYQSFRSKEQEYYPTKEPADTGLETSAITSFFNSLREFLTGLGFRSTNVDPAKINSLPAQTSAQNVPVQQTRLDLKMENTTNLIVDGRVLASIVKPFLANDLIRTEASQGTISKRYII